MKVTVFGASGKVGQLVTKRLLQDGHDVVGFVHRSSPFKDNEHLEIIQGDIHNIEDVRKAVKDSEVIISTLGSWGTKSKDIVSSGVENIISVAKDNNIKRVVTLTGSDAITRDDRVNIIGRILHFFIYLSPVGKILADGNRHIKLLENSKLDWTVLRSPIMNHRGNADNYSVGNTKPKLWQTINRISVAEAMVSLLLDTKYYKQAPYIKRAKTSRSS